MKEMKKTKAQLVREVEQLRRRVSELEATPGKKADAEKALRESEERFRLIAESIQEVFWMSTPGIEEMLYVSPAYEELWGRSTESLYKTPQSFIDGIHPEDRERVVAALSGHARGAWDLDYRILRPDGSMRWIQDRGFPIKDEHGNVRLMTGVARDVTEQRRAQELLQEKNEVLESIFSNVQFLVAYMDKNFNFIQVNPAYAEADNREPEFFVGKNHFGLYPNEENEAIFRTVVKTGQPYHVYDKPFEYAGLPERGVTYWDWSLFPVKGPGGTVTGVVLSLVNTTERRRAQESSQITERRFHHIFEAVPVSIWIEDFSQVIDGIEGLKTQGVKDFRDYFMDHPDFVQASLERVKIVDVNKKSLAMFGAGNKDELKIALNRVFLPETLQVFQEELVALAQRKGTFESEVSVQTLQGETKHIFFNISFPEEQSQFDDVLVSIMDITRRKNAEEALHASRVLLEKTFASLEEVVFVVDVTTRTIINCNAAIEKVFGYTTDEVIGRNTELLHVDREMYKQFGRGLYPALDAEGVFRCEFQMRRKDGSVFLTEHTVTQIIDEKGRRIHVVSVLRDITERKRTEDALRRSQEQLRNLSAQLLDAHEAERKLVARELHDSIGASLTALKFGLERYFDRLQEKEIVSEGTRPEDLVALVKETIKETRRIQQNLRPLILDNLGVSVALRSLCREIEKLYPGIRLNHVLDVPEEEIPEPLKIVLYRVSQEALNNAVKHSGAKAVDLSLRKVEGHIELTVQDDGKGFDPRKIPEGDRVERDRMGLTNMKERSELSGGTFSMTSSKGKGTVIRASWPCD